MTLEFSILVQSSAKDFRDASVRTSGKIEPEHTIAKGVETYSPWRFCGRMELWKPEQVSGASKAWGGTMCTSETEVGLPGRFIHEDGEGLREGQRSQKESILGLNSATLLRNSRPS